MLKIFGLATALSLLSGHFVKGQEPSARTVGNSGSLSSGLLANLLNQHPTGEGPLERSVCCCASGTCPPTATTAPIDDYDDINNADLVGSGLIDPRSKNPDEFEPRATNPEDLAVVTRIVNNPPPDRSSPLIGASCPAGKRTCCYSSVEYVKSLGGRCVPAAGGPIDSAWCQGCKENVPASPAGKSCGERIFTRIPGLKQGEASPDEFPWTCIILTSHNDYIGGCAIVPDSANNDITHGTRRVITAAHKLQTLQRNDLLKVRILEYDASDFKSPETIKHKEYTVVRILKHPRFDLKRLSNDIALLVLDEPIELLENSGVNAACLPACRNMFDYTFSNGTGTRCWVAGWGKDSPNGNFQVLQNKVDVPIYDRLRCDNRLRNELVKINPQLGSKFVLHPGELCAGGEEGKDACEGDGGSPLVCQSETGHFHVVGLVAWGVGCAHKDVPGVYVNIYHYLDFITQPF